MTQESGISRLIEIFGLMTTYLILIYYGIAFGTDSGIFYFLSQKLERYGILLGNFPILLATF
jgi:hypothetical protein